MTISVLVLVFFMGYSSPCQHAFRMIESGHVYADHAYREAGLTDLKANAESAMEVAREALDLTKDCGCEGAVTPLSAVYTFSRDAVAARGIEDGKYFARRVRTAFDNALTEIEECVK